MNETKEIKYGSYTFLVQKAGGVDGMDGLFLLAKGALPGFQDLVLKGRDLFAREDVRAGAQAARSILEGKDVATGFQSPAPEVSGGTSARGSLAGLLPVMQALSKVLDSVSREEREELRRLYLFNGLTEVMFPESYGHAPEGQSVKRIKKTLTREVFDRLFEGDALGAWLLFLQVIGFNLGKSSPALAGLRDLFPRALGGKDTSETSGTSGVGSTG